MRLSWCCPLRRERPAPENELLYTPGTGVGKLYLATPRWELPHVDMLAEHSEPLVDKSIEQVRESCPGDAVFQMSLRNKVKVCAKCGKPCAYSLASCNACGASLEGIDLSFTDNIFMGFIYGISRGNFPYRISLRRQTPDVLCFDDPLAMSLCHFNAIPTSAYIPDLRYLFIDPPQALKLVNRLFETAATAALEQFWRNEAFRNFFWQGEPEPPSPEALEALVLAGMNFPPSMYQLHIQFIHAPLLPFHFAQALHNQHFHYQRFFPLEFLRAALAKGDAVKMSVDEDTSISDILRKVEEQGVNYDRIHAEMMQKLRVLQARFCCWKESDFTHQVINGQVFTVGDVKRQPDKDPKALQSADCRALQSYGRPYDAAGKPSGTCYRYAKKLGSVRLFSPVAK